MDENENRNLATVDNGEVTPVTLAEFVLEEQQRAEKLLPLEEHWRDRYELLLDHGYRLRSRLRPGWVPSWRNTEQHPDHLEDGYKHCVSSPSDSIICSK